MLGCARIHQGAAPLVFSIVPCICDMYNVITRNTQRWRVTMRLHAEINTHIERVGTQKSWRWNLRGQVWVPWGWESMRGGTSASPFCTTRGDFKSRLTDLIWIFQTSEVTDSPSGLLWNLSVDGSVHHCREKWATSAVHWLSSTVPPPNRTCSS